jgi:hypothetical protein
MIGLNWLNDEVINFFMGLLQQRELRLNPGHSHTSLHLAECVADGRMFGYTLGLPLRPVYRSLYVACLRSSLRLPLLYIANPPYRHLDLCSVPYPPLRYPSWSVLCTQPTLA